MIIVLPFILIGIKKTKKVISRFIFKKIIKEMTPNSAPEAKPIGTTII